MTTERRHDIDWLRGNRDRIAADLPHSHRFPAVGHVHRIYQER
jgi:hypothetical protein